MFSWLLLMAYTAKFAYNFLFVFFSQFTNYDYFFFVFQFELDSERGIAVLYVKNKESFDKILSVSLFSEDKGNQSS